MAGPAINPLAIFDPQSVADQNTIEFQRQMAQALMSGGMQQPQGQMAGQVYVGPSWTQGLANMLKVYGGKQMMDTANKQSVALAQRQGQMLRGAFGIGTPEQSQTSPDPVQQGLAQGAATGSVGPTNSNAALVNALRNQPQAPATQVTPKAGPMTIPGMNPQEAMARYIMSPEEYSKALMANYMPTDLQKNANAAGLGPNAIGDVVRKEGYIPPNKVSQGEVALDPATGRPIIAAPKTADGINVDYADPLHPTASAVPGYAGASAGIKGAETHAVESNKVYTGVPGPNGEPQSGFLFGGSPSFQTSNPAGMRQKLESIKDPTQRQQALSAFDAQYPKATKAGVIVGPDPTVQKGREGLQSDMVKKWGDLTNQNSQAQTTISYLENIKQLAPKAMTGQLTDKLQYVNGLLSFVGGQKATDEKTANDLLNKYGSQIVARLGQGGLGTDSARAILQSAYPSAHMSQDAIREASDNLIAATKMTQAKAGLLAKHANASDPASYNNAEIAFDRVADPRIWQLHGMDAASAKRYLSTLPPSVAADLRQRAATLKQMGVF